MPAWHNRGINWMSNLQQSLQIMGCKNRHGISCQDGGTKWSEAVPGVCGERENMSRDEGNTYLG